MVDVVKIDGKVFVIAEAGVNHNGELDLAHRLIDAAVEAGADAVKFQTFSADALVTKAAPKAAYQKKVTDPGQTQHLMLAALELSDEAHHALKSHADDSGIEFMSTPFDRRSLAFLVNDLDVKTLKIASPDLTDGPLIFDTARSGRPIIMSTGMSTLEEISEALDLVAYAMAGNDAPQSREEFVGWRHRKELTAKLHEAVTLLHCTSAYPAPVDAVNLLAITVMQQEFGLRVGYSDHTVGMAVPIAAAALGATVIERHITLDRTMSGPDHSASTEPEEFAQLVAAIRSTEKALGAAVKQSSEVEQNTRQVARKSVFAARDITANTVFAAEDLSIKRPGDGISPMAYWDIIGRPATRDFKINEKIEQ